MAGPGRGLLLFCAALATARALKITRVAVPSTRRVGEPVALECDYDLEGDRLYSVKWYKGMLEFFRFTPGDQFPSKTFSLPGVLVDGENSNGRLVSLRPITLAASGVYRCEVSTDAPWFRTETRQASMLVVELPPSPPSLHGLRPLYLEGEYLEVNCSSERSRPAAALTWYINGEQAESRHLRQYAPRGVDGNLETSTLGLRLTVGGHHLSQKQLVLRCVASISNVYYKSTQERVTVRHSQAVFSGSPTLALASPYLALTVCLLRPVFT